MTLNLNYLAGIKLLNRQQKRNILVTIDITLVPLALFLAYALQLSFHSPVQAFLDNWALLPLLLIATAALSLLIGVARVRIGSYEARAVWKTALFAASLMVVSAALASLGGLDIPSGFHVNFGLVFFLLNVFSRLMMLKTLNFIYRLITPMRRVVIYGAGQTGTQLAHALRADREIEVLAFVDDNPSLRGVMIAGLPIYAAAQVEALLADGRVDQVLLAMPSASQTKRNKIARRFEDLGVEVKSLPSFAQLIGDSQLVDKLIHTPPSTFLGRRPHQNEALLGQSEYTGRNVLITGAGGSIGSELCRQLLAYNPARITLLDNSEFALFTSERELLLQAERAGVEINVVLGSVADPVLVERTLQKFQIEVVLHAAAYKHVTLVEKNPLAGIENNVHGTAVMAQQARAHGVRRFVLVSTDKAVRPASIMGATKRMAELLVLDIAKRTQNTVFSIVRFGNVLGSSGSVVPLFQEQIANGGPVTLTDENATRYFMTVQEAAQLVLLAGSFAEGSDVFVLDMGKPVQVKSLARQMVAAAGYSVRDDDNPNGDIEIVTTGLRKGEKMHEELMVAAGNIVTSHEKIFRVREDGLSEIEIAAALKALRERIERGDETGAVEILCERIAIPEAGAVADSGTEEAI